MNRRKVVVALAAAVPVTALLGLLTWAMAQSGGRPGGIGINTSLGEVSIKQQSARDFTLNLFDGGTLKLPDLKGQLVMVDFWASWCPPCRREAPVLAQVYLEYQDREVEFVGVAVWDSEKDAKSYVRSFGITYPNGLDEKGIIAVDYGVTGIPEKYFIDPGGVLVKKLIGPVDEDRLREVLDELLQETSPDNAR